MKKSLLVILSIALTGCAQEKKEYSPEIEAEAQRAVDSMLLAAKKPVGAETNCKYDNDVDKMGEKTIFAKVQSPDVLDFDAPYSGGAISTLMLRKGKSGTDIMYMVSTGQIVSASVVDGGTIRIRFDEEKPIAIGVNTASDGSSDVLFLDSVQKLINKMKVSKKMVLEVEFYQEGNRQIEFNVENLKWD